MELIDKLKNLGFFDLNKEKQIEFLRQHGFFNVSNEKRINLLETIGFFDVDINDDPPNLPLYPDKVDYLKEETVNKQNNKVANEWKESFVSNAIENDQLVINDVRGIENALEVQSGAIITFNHFHPFESFALERALMNARIQKEIYKVIREGNYTNFPGEYGFYFRNGNTLPLSQIHTTMRKFNNAMREILSRGDLIMVAPEQAMWHNYRKPKPFKIGAFKWAAENNVPVIPTFIAMRSQDESYIEEEIPQDYTIFIGRPIYPNKDLTIKQNALLMRDDNYAFCKSVYERYYNTQLTYKTIIHEDLPDFVKSTPSFNKMSIVPDEYQKER